MSIVKKQTTIEFMKKKSLKYADAADLIHQTMSLIPLLNSRLVYPYKPYLPNGLTQSQLRVLFVVSAEEPVRMQDLAAHCSVTKQQINYEIGKLENAGLVERRTDPQNRRIVRVFLSEDGIRLMNEIDSHLYKELEPAFAGLSETEKKEYQEAVETVLKFLQKVNPGK